MAFQGYLRSDTATVIPLGPYVAIADGVTYVATEKEEMNHANTGIRISKNGGALAARTTLTEPVYDAFGYYLVNLDATDTATPGRLKVIYGSAAVVLPCEADFVIIPHELWDTLFVTQPCAAIKKLFDVASPTGTVNSLPDAVAGAANGLAIIDATGAKLTKTVDLTANQTIAITRPTGAVATDGGNSATVFKTNLTSATADFWVGAWLKLTSGDLLGQVRKISDYDGANKIVTVAPAFTGTPADAVTFVIVNE